MTIDKTVVLLTHGIGVTGSSWQFVKRILERSGHVVDTFDWNTEMAYLRSKPYGMRELRAAYARRLETFQARGQSVVAVNHSAGCYVAGHHHGHSAIVGSMHLALPPFGPYIKLGKTNPDSQAPAVPMKRSVQIAMQCLLGQMVTFSRAEQQAYGSDKAHTEDSLVVSGSVLRAFGIPGLYLGPNRNSGKRCLVHISANDHIVAPSWRNTWLLDSWGLERIEGWNNLSHCSYTYRSNAMVQFWKHISGNLIPEIVRGTSTSYEPRVQLLPA